MQLAFDKINKNPNFNDFSLYSCPIWGHKHEFLQSKQFDDFDEIISMEDHLKAGGFGSWLMENVKIKNNFKLGYISNSVIGKVGDEKWLLKNLVIE